MIGHGAVSLVLFEIVGIGACDARLVQLVRGYCVNVIEGLAQIARQSIQADDKCGRADCGRVQRLATWLLAFHRPIHASIASIGRCGRRDGRRVVNAVHAATLVHAIANGAQLVVDSLVSIGVVCDRAVHVAICEQTASIAIVTIDVLSMSRIDRGRSRTTVRIRVLTRRRPVTSAQTDQRSTALVVVQRCAELAVLVVRVYHTLATRERLG